MGARDPFFPPARPKGAPGYREAGRAREAGESTAPGPELPREAKPIVVVRPDAHPEETKPASAETDRAFWHRQSFFANYPRVCGAALAATGGWGLAIGIEAVLHRHFIASALAFPPLFSVGLFILITGYPTDVEGRPQRWWRRGAVVAALASFTAALFATFLF